MDARDYVYDPTETPFQPRAESYHAHNALGLACASNLAYEDSAIIEPMVRQWGFDHYRFVQEKETQAFVCGNANLVLLLFRGTEARNLKDWHTNVMLKLVSGPAGEVHRGFWEALMGIWPKLQDALSESRTAQQPLWLGGHSLGGALALLAGARLQLQEQIPVQGVYTFGQPRAGNYSFARAFDQAFEGRGIRFINNNDIVPHVPLPGPRLRYWHTERLIYIDGEGKLSPDLPLWKRLRNSFQGATRDLDKLGQEAFRDHAMNSYVYRIREAIKSGR